MAVRRVITSRAGGISAQPFDSFNLGDHVGDKPEAVQHNRARLADQIGVSAEKLIWMEQIHSRTVSVIETPQAAPVEATDALVTAVPGIALAVVTADCVPLLLSDDDAGVIAAVHAGRIGARIGIVPEVISVMTSLGARVERIGVLMGPAACGKHYEVPAVMASDVEKHLPGSSCRTEKGTAGIDLRCGLRRQLQTLGVFGIASDPRCTIEDAQLFSYRRAKQTGRFASVIWNDLSKP